MAETAPDETLVDTGYGTLPVPNSLLALWNRYGWPEEQVLKRMTEAGTVEAPATPDPGSGE